MKNILTILLFLFSSSVFSQTELGAFNLTGSGYSTTSATDYQCLGINPANLGWTWNDKKINLGLLESGASIYSEPLNRQQVMGDMFSNDLVLSMQERKDAASEFKDKRISSNVALTWFGFSYQNDKFGGIAFSIRDKGNWSSVLNEYGARFLFLGYNDPYFDIKTIEQGDSVGYASNPGLASVVYKGTSQNFSWTREYNLGYGRMIMNKENFSWYGGIGFKFMTTYAGTIYSQDKGDDYNVFSALSPVFEVEYDEPTPSQISGSGLKKVGTGWGFDIGTTLLLYNKVKIAVALNEIGQMKYNGNVYSGRDVYVWRCDSKGIDNYNIFAQGQLIVADNPPGDSSMWIGLADKKYTLPMHLRAGASYRIIDEVEIGTDFYIPLNKYVPGSYEAMVFGFGGRYSPAKWVELSIGVVTGGKFGTNLPFGVSFFPVKKETTWQVGIATRDLITFFNEKTPTVSGAFGFMRFSFGNKNNEVPQPSVGQTGS